MMGCKETSRNWNRFIFDRFHCCKRCFCLRFLFSDFSVDSLKIQRCINGGIAVSQTRFYIIRIEYKSCS